jgi:hypothetical protein
MILINLALKTFIDVFNNNKYISKISGVDIKEYNDIELELVLIIGFKLHVSAETFNQYKDFLLHTEKSQEDVEASCSALSLSACKISMT